MPITVTGLLTRITQVPLQEGITEDANIGDQVG
jgi:hypothetical protein